MRALYRGVARRLHAKNCVGTRDPCLFFLLGCPVADLQPLYISSDEVTEPALVGNWAVPDSDEKETVSIEKSSGSSYIMKIPDAEDGFTDAYEIHLVRLGADLFGDVRFSSRASDKKHTNIDMPVGIISAHTVVKIQIVNDDLAWSTIEDDALKKISATDKPPLAYQDYDPDGILVTADTSALRRYVTAHATDGFSEPEHWRRASK